MRVQVAGRRLQAAGAVGTDIALFEGSLPRETEQLPEFPPNTRWLGNTWPRWLSVYSDDCRVARVPKPPSVDRLVPFFPPLKHISRSPVLVPVPVPVPDDTSFCHHLPRLSSSRRKLLGATARHRAGPLAALAMGQWMPIPAQLPL